MIKLKKLKLKREQLENLPLYFNYIVYNEMMDEKKSLLKYKYDEETSANIFYSSPDKPISKIIDYQKK